MNELVVAVLPGLWLHAVGDAEEIAKLDWVDREVARELPKRGPTEWMEGLIAWVGWWAHGSQGVSPAPLPLKPVDGFTGLVLRRLLRVPYGETITYGELAAQVDRPGAARAVAQACGANPFPLVIPCHRVVAADGGLGGYSGLGGVKTKRLLLVREGAWPASKPGPTGDEAPDSAP